MRETTKTETTHIVRLDGKEIINLMYGAGVQISEDVEVIFEVPGGGDYSNCQVPVDGDNCVRVTWKTFN